MEDGNFWLNLLDHPGGRGEVVGYAIAGLVDRMTRIVILRSLTA